MSQGVGAVDEVERIIAKPAETVAVQWVQLHIADAPQPLRSLRQHVGGDISAGPGTTPGRQSQPEPRDSAADLQHIVSYADGRQFGQISNWLCGGVTKLPPPRLTGYRSSRCLS